MGMKFRTFLGAAAVLALAGASAPAADKDAADIAVEAAKKYAGTTISIVWEAGLQSLDPLNYSGPKWEKLTGIKVKVVEVPPTRCSPRSCRTSNRVPAPMTR